MNSKTCRRPDIVCKFEFTNKFNVVVTILFKNFPSLSFMTTVPFLATLPILITFCIPHHVANFGKVVSPLTQGWVETMDLSIYS